MKHPKFKYHTFNKIRNLLNKPDKWDYYAYFFAWYYFQFKKYEVN